MRVRSVPGSARFAFALAAMAVLACAPAARAQGLPAADSTAVADSVAVRDSAVVADTSRVPAVEYLWVLRNSLVHPDDVPLLVARAKAMGVRGLLVQVVGRGDGWYRSDLLPYPEALREPGRDPLGELLPLAHAAGLEVHAWVNCCLVWSSPARPRDPKHVLNAHPEWIARTDFGRPMTRMSPRERQRRMVEGVFLSPAHPGVRHWLANIAREIAVRYPVDGVHLDYIRQPGVRIGFDPTTRALFAGQYGADPDPSSPATPFHRLPLGERAGMDAAWAAFQQEQVTAIVREVRDSLNAVRPGIALTAAVLADTAAAVQRNRQAWSSWLRDSLLDRAFAMCYAPMVQTVMSQLAAMATQVGTDRLVPGIAIYNTSPAICAAKIKGARALGFTAVALYSYDSLWERNDLWARLRDFVNGPRTLEAHP